MQPTRAFWLITWVEWKKNARCVGSLTIMISVTRNASSDYGGFPAGRLGSHKGALRLPSRVSNALNGDWQRHVLASSGYLELGMFDDAALALEEIEPEDKTRNEVLGARVTSTWQPRNGTWPQRLPAIW